MKKLNKEQQVARMLYYLNNLIGILAMIPASVFWLASTLETIEYPNIEASFFLLGATILLITFYGYIFRCPCIHKVEKYNKQISFWYWMIVLLTNLLTILFFVITNHKELVLIPLIPFIFSVIGLITHFSKEAI